MTDITKVPELSKEERVKKASQEIQETLERYDLTMATQIALVNNEDK